MYGVYRLRVSAAVFNVPACYEHLSSATNL
jgi:hypothetical protein